MTVYLENSSESTTIQKLLADFVIDTKINCSSLYYLQPVTKCNNNKRIYYGTNLLHCNYLLYIGLLHRYKVL